MRPLVKAIGRHVPDAAVVQSTRALTSIGRPERVCHLSDPIGLLLAQPKAHPTDNTAHVLVKPAAGCVGRWLWMAPLRRLWAAPPVRRPKLLDRECGEIDDGERGRRNGAYAVHLVNDLGQLLARTQCP